MSQRSLARGEQGTRLVLRNPTRLGVDATIIAFPFAEVDPRPQEAASKCTMRWHCADMLFVTSRDLYPTSVRWREQQY